MALSTLRECPERDIRDTVYYTVANPRAHGGQIQGFTVSIRESYSFFNRSMRRLILTDDPDGHDYYFPYVHGLGAVHVPYVAPPGTIAITDCMNGCTLEVWADDANARYTFYHDLNGRFLRGGPLAANRPLGVRVCKIDDGGYYDSKFITREVERLQREKHIRGIMPGVQFICVYNRARWTVVASGVFLYGNEAIASFIPKDLYKGVQSNVYGMFDNMTFRIFKYQNTE